MRRLTQIVVAVLAVGSAIAVTGVTGATAGTPTAAAPSGSCRSVGCLRLNQLQFLSSHNSYHVQAEPDIFALIKSFDPALAATLEYSHPPLATQLSDERLRHLELDVFADPQGGRYADHHINVLLGKPIASTNPDLYRPGLKVMHAQEVEFNTRCTTFVACLRQIKGWSDAHPKHLPIAIQVELKEDPIPDPANLGFVQPLPFDATQIDEVDREIRSVLPSRSIITPDDVRGHHATLEEAVLSGDAWPTIDHSRGKFLFLLDNESKRALYLDGHPSLEGRIMFTPSTPGQPDAAFIKDNDPLGPDGLEWQRIQGYVAAGYVVRTRADADTVQARTGDTTMRDAALRSGAQWVSTDYPTRREISPFGTDYFVELPGGGVARCNPISAPFACTVRRG